MYFDYGFTFSEICAMAITPILISVAKNFCVANIKESNVFQMKIALDSSSFSVTTPTSVPISP